MLITRDTYPSRSVSHPPDGLFHTVGGVGAGRGGEIGVNERTVSAAAAAAPGGFQEEFRVRNRDGNSCPFFSTRSRPGFRDDASPLPPPPLPLARSRSLVGRNELGVHKLQLTAAKLIRYERPHPCVTRVRVTSANAHLYGIRAVSWEETLISGEGGAR